MKLQKISVITDHENAGLISDAMFDVGAKCVEIIAREDLNSMGDVTVTAVVKADDKDYLPALEEILSELKENGVEFSEPEIDIVDDEDWDNLWK